MIYCLSKGLRCRSKDTVAHQHVIISKLFTANFNGSNEQRRPIPKMLSIFYLFSKYFAFLKKKIQIWIWKQDGTDLQLRQPFRLTINTTNSGSILKIIEISLISNVIILYCACISDSQLVILNQCISHSQPIA